ncbi:restriction endonuclease subunit S [Marinobacter algicola]|uniref:restriction endonuclease subunit S n=1 Tax=Marinobacter algicola TaxID=236100 RepID=UPI003BA949A1
MSWAWESIELGNVADIRYGYTAKASWDKQGPKFLRITDIQNGAVHWDAVPTAKMDKTDFEKHRLKSGDIVFARTGATTGKSYKISSPPDAVPASYLIRLRLKDTNILPEYVSYFFQTEAYWNVINLGTSGSAQGGFNASKLSQLTIPKPTLSEQKRIVAILDEAFAGIDTAIANTEKNLANARELFESCLNSVFCTDGRWNEFELSGLVERDCSLSYGIVQPGGEVASGLPVVRPTDLGNKIITLDGLKRIDPSLAKSYTRTVLQGHELLLCVRGSTGTVSLASEELKGANVTRGIVPIRFDQSIVGQAFGYYSLRTPTAKRQIANKTYGAALMQINIRDLRKLKLGIPPIALQHEIVAEIEEVEMELQRLESIYARKLEVLHEFKQSLLHKAFSGELTASLADKELGEAVA